MRSIFQIAKTNFSAGMIAITVLILLGANLVVKGNRTQTTQKTFGRIVYKNEPFKVENLSIGGHVLSTVEGAGSQVEAAINSNPNKTADDWLQGLSFSLNNRTDRTITALHFSLAFPETKASGPMLVYDFYAGKIPSARSNKEPLAITTDQSYQFSLSDTRLESLKRFVAGGGFPLGTLNKAQLRITAVYFSDQGKWEQGEEYVADADNPGRYKKAR